MATYDLTKEIPAAADLLADDILNCTYTGSEITIELPAGSFKLECYGAAGTKAGRYTSLLGGEGGYSYGTLSITETTRFYLNAGGQGTTSTSSSTKNTGGYNGGGYSYYYAGPGGGATHIATSSGLLSSLSSTTGSIIIVAGGGGGASSYSSSSSSTYQGKGGKGGGESGEAGYYGTSNTSSNALKYAGQGGTQTAGGAAGTNSSRAGSAGSFGQGGNGGSASSSYYGEGGGGGGYYGGGGASGYEAGGGGGSGYLSSDLTDSATSQGGNDSTGYIIITVLEIYASTHKITFYDGTTEIGVVETAGEETITLPTAPTKNGYKFLGYYLSDGTTKITESSYATTKLTEDVACFAKYRKYKVEFYVDGVSTYQIATTGKETVTFPAEPTKEGYAFKEWQVNGTTTAFNQTYLDAAYLTADLKVNAVWIQKYTISFICDGTTYKEYQSIGYEEIAVPETTPIKEGYTFEGWFLDSSFQTPYTTDYFKSIAIEKDYTIYGELTEDVPDEPTTASNVNFYVQGSLYATITTKGKEILTLPLEPSISGYTFGGWYSDEAYSIPFTSTSLENRWINKDLSIYAKLTEIPKYLISFIINGRTYYSYKTAGKETLKQPSTPKITDYDFEGWYWDEDCTDEFDADKYISTYLTENLNVYAKVIYTKKNVISFYSSITSTTAYATITTTGKETLELPTDPTADLGYEFDDWYLDKKFKTAFDITYYQTHYLTGDISVYANFKASTTGPYSLTIAKDGEGSISPDVGTHEIAKGTTTEITIMPTTLPFKYLEVDSEIVEPTETTVIDPESACAYFDFNTEATDVLGRSTTSTSGTPAISTDQIKFGAGSIYFDGTAALLITLPDSFDDAFTVEFWFYSAISATSGIYPTLFSTNTDNLYGGVYCAVDDGSYSDSMVCRANAASSSGNNGSYGAECDRSVWNHFCYCRSGSNNYYFLNGSLMATVTQSTPITVNIVCLGGLMRSSTTSGMLSSDYLTGYIDDLLISNTCKHTSDFSIPTAAYNATKTTYYSYKIENQAANVSAIAHFGELEDFTITSSARDGTISPSGETTIKEGNSQTFTFSPTASQSLKALLVDGVSVEVEQSGSSYSYTLKNIHKDKNVVAIFSPLLYWKTNGKWFGISKVFKKVNGAWVEQEADTLANIFSTTENYIEGVNDEESTT